MSVPVTTPGKRLRELMDQENLTTRELGEIIGVSHTSISRYLADKSQMRSDALGKLALHFGITPTWLMGYDVPQHPANVVNLPEPHRVKIIGDVACGKPIYHPDEDEYLTVYGFDAANVAVRASGDSSAFPFWPGTHRASFFTLSPLSTWSVRASSAITSRGRSLSSHPVDDHPLRPRLPA